MAKPNDAPETIEAQPEAPAGPKLLTVKLLYDTWIGETRVPGPMPQETEDGKPLIDPTTKLQVIKYNIVNLPLDLAKRLLADKKAERADPLPE